MAGKLNNADILREARDRWSAGVEADKLNRTRDYEDRKFYTGGDNQWIDGKGKNVAAERRKDGRPALSYSRMGQFVKQVSGELRQNKPAIKVLPVDGQTDPAMADVYSAIIRHIEGGSGAHRIYAKAGEQAAIGGQGWWRIKADYCSDDGFEQELIIERIPNPLAVVCDPAAKAPTRSDMKWGFVSEMVPRKDFEANYPDVNTADFDSGEQTEWVQGDFVRVAEYWRRAEDGKQRLFMLTAEDGRQITTTEAEVRQIAESQGLKLPKLDADYFASEGFKLEAERMVTAYKIESIMICGAGALGDWQPWPGKYIPLVRVVGEEVEAGDTVFRHGMIHHAKAPQVGYNYARNAMMERHQTSTKSPWLVTVKMIEKFKAMWETANSKNHAALVFEPDPQAPQGPQRQPPPQIDGAAYQEALVASEDMKAATGIYDAALGAKSNETSGVAIARRDAQGDTATFVYIDNLEDAIETTGRMLVDLIPHYYSDDRVVRILGEDDEVEKFEAINKLLPDGKKWNDVTRGKYDVVVNTGPAYSTRRQEAQDKMLKLTENPQIAAVASDVLVRAMDIPMGDKLADRLKRILPAGIDDDADKERAERQQQSGQGPPPDPAQQAMAAEMQMKQADMARQAQEGKAKIALQEQEMQGKLRIAHEEMLGRLEIEREKVRGQLALDREKAHMAAANAAHATNMKVEAQEPAEAE